MKINPIELIENINDEILRGEYFETTTPKLEFASYSISDENDITTIIFTANGESNFRINALLISETSVNCKFSENLKGYEDNFIKFLKEKLPNMTFGKYLFDIEEVFNREVLEAIELLKEVSFYNRDELHKAYEKVRKLKRY